MQCLRGWAAGEWFFTRGAQAQPSVLARQAGVAVIVARLQLGSRTPLAGGGAVRFRGLAPTRGQALDGVVTTLRCGEPSQGHAQVVPWQACVWALVGGAAFGDEFVLAGLGLGHAGAAALAQAGQQVPLRALAALVSGVEDGFAAVVTAGFGHEAVFKRQDLGGVAQGEGQAVEVGRPQEVAVAAEDGAELGLGLPLARTGLCCVGGIEPGLLQRQFGAQRGGQRWVLQQVLQQSLGRCFVTQPGQGDGVVNLRIHVCAVQHQRSLKVLGGFEVLPQLVELVPQAGQPGGLVLALQDSGLPLGQVVRLQSLRYQLLTQGGHGVLGCTLDLGVDGRVSAQHHGGKTGDVGQFGQARAVCLAGGLGVVHGSGLTDAGRRVQGVGVDVMGHAHAFEQEGAHGHQAGTTAELGDHAFAHQNGMGQLGGHVNQAPGDCDGSAQNQVGAPARGAEGAHHGAPGFNANAQGQGLKPCGGGVRKAAVHGFLEVNSRQQGVRGVVSLLAPPDGQHGVSLKCFDDAAVGLDHLGGHREKCVQDCRSLLRGARFGVGREVADVGKEDGDLLFCGLDGIGGRLEGQRSGNGLGQVAGQVCIEPVTVDAALGVFQDAHDQARQNNKKGWTGPTDPDRVAGEGPGLRQPKQGGRAECPHWQQVGREAAHAQSPKCEQAEQRCQCLNVGGDAGLVRGAPIEQCGDELGVHVQAGVGPRERGGHGVVQAKGGAADQHPSLVEQARRDAPGQDIGCGQADQAVGVQAPGDTQVAVVVQGDVALGQRGAFEPPVSVHPGRAAPKRQAGFLPPRQNGREAECGVAVALVANDGGHVAHTTVCGDAGRDVPNVLGSRGHCGGVGEVAAGCLKGGGAAWPRQ